MARVDGRRPPMKGESIYVRPQSGHVHLFDTKTGLRLGDYVPDLTARPDGGSSLLEGRRRAVTVPDSSPFH